VVTATVGATAPTARAMLRHNVPPLIELDIAPSPVQAWCGRRLRKPRRNAHGSPRRHHECRRRVGAAETRGDDDQHCGVRHDPDPLHREHGGYERTARLLVFMSTSV
jgi:hypothetical protein